MIVLKATQEKLLSVLQSVAGIVEKRHTLPILANVLLRSRGTAIGLRTEADALVVQRTHTTTGFKNDSLESRCTLMQASGERAGREHGGSASRRIAGVRLN